VSSFLARLVASLHTELVLLKSNKELAQNHGKLILQKSVVKALVVFICGKDVQKTTSRMLVITRQIPHERIFIKAGLHHKEFLKKNT
jgi:hypothetical protein